VAVRGLTDRLVLVTGAGRGIGAAIARRFAAEGARLLLVDIDPASVRAVAAELGADHAVVDLRDPAGVTVRLGESVRSNDGVDVLVNNAGVFAKVGMLDLDIGTWDDVLAVNARAVLLTTQLVAPGMIDRGRGRIVNIASMAARVGTPGEAAYAASKAAVLALTRIAAMELGVHGITVNAVCPGYVLTDMGASTRSPEQIEGWCARSPLGRTTTPDDVAATVAFLASDDAADLTGQAINVSSGLVMG
jgi:NAD(P)-dependent dehydrogenase (short-subunit alcohol dehydrogenase family)